MFVVWCPRPSRSARRLAKALKGRQKGPGDFIRDGSVVINWGDSECPVQCLNSARALKEVTNKRRCFEVLAAAGVPVPLFATGKENVTWNGITVVRHKLTGHSGEGIELIPPGGDMPDAPLYVQYIKKEQEYRMHVGRNGNVYKLFAAQRKARRLDCPLERVNWQIRNHANGFVYVREDIDAPCEVENVAVEAVAATGLDFGAVDVIYNTKEQKAYVLEINTAPGLEGQTVDDYVNFLNAKEHPSYD